MTHKLTGEQKEMTVNIMKLNRILDLIKGNVANLNVAFKFADPDKDVVNDAVDNLLYSVNEFKKEVNNDT